MARNVAIFDFDNTLITGDSLWPFLTGVAGRGACVLALAQAAGWLSLCFVAGKPVPDRRNFFKDYLLRKILGGRKPESLAEAARAVRGWQKPIAVAQDALHFHRARGDAIVIASGSLDLYMPVLLEDLPYDALICTEMERRGEDLTGRMSLGNCVRARKAERVAAWLAAQEPFDEIWAYGNYPHDLPMMALARHKVIIS